MTGVEALDRTVAELLEKAESPARRRRVVLPRGWLRLAFAGAAVAAIVAALVVVGASGGGPPRRTALPVVPGVDPRLVQNFAIFRRPQRAGDVPSPGEVNLGVGGRYGVDRLHARRATIGTDGQPIWVIPARGYVCLSAGGCAEIPFAIRKGTAAFGQCGLASGSNSVAIRALLPDRAAKVRVRLRDGREIPQTVRGNVLAVTMPTSPASVTPTTIVWDGPLGHDASTLGGVAAQNRCAPIVRGPAIAPRAKQLDPIDRLR